MMETAAAAHRDATRRHLLARALGVLTSPRATYAEIAADPRPFGALALVVVLCSAPLAIFMSTERGQLLSLDRQMTVLESFGVEVTDQRYEGMLAGASQAVYWAVGGQALAIPVVTLAVAALAIALFNGLLGGNASFAQVFAVAAHANFVGALGLLVTLPFNYAREVMSSPVNLAVFLPMLDDTGFAARFLGAIDLFRVWWLVSLAIGLAVLYRRRTPPIAWCLLAAYAVVALAIAGVMTVLSGA